jgi:hypothetical protein
VEFAEARVHFEVLFHYVEAVAEGDAEGSPHVVGDVAEGSLAGFELFFEFVAVGGSAAEMVY